jgi:hypothetical protein
MFWNRDTASSRNSLLESTPSQVSSNPAYPDRAEYAYPLTVAEFALETPDLFASHASVLGIYTPGPGYEHKWRTSTALDPMIEFTEWLVEQKCLP